MVTTSGKSSSSPSQPGPAVAGPGASPPPAQQAPGQQTTSTPPPPVSAGRPPNHPGLIPLLANTITSVDAFAVDAGSLLYIYRGGVYVPEADRHIKHEVKRLLVVWDKTARWSTHLAEEVAAYI